MDLFDRILAARGLDSSSVAAFLSPDYSAFSDPFLLPDMAAAVQRLVTAHQNQEKIIIYGDYDIDGLTATALILDAFASFGYISVSSVIPNRFEDGYGLTIDAIEKIASCGATLILTVDCGSTSVNEIVRANELGIDVIVTDHHNALETQPPAVAIVNPKRADNKYPFVDLAGVGVAFKLVQALQTKFNDVTPSTGSGFPFGQEKWLLDLVALGTVCDIVPLINENRTNVFWGLKVLSKQRRIGLKALMAVADVNPNKVSARSLGFALGPRMNAAGRLETAQYALDLLTTNDNMEALDEANRLDEMNIARRKDQGKIVKEAEIQVEKYIDDKVLVLCSADWNSGIVGIVASKIVEKYHKPTFVLQEIGDETKGSARSFGDFSVADAINYSKDCITGGGGHRLAAGVTLPTANIDDFRKSVNKYYDILKLSDQSAHFLPNTDAIAELGEISEDIVDQVNQLEPFGIGNPQPILQSDNLTVKNIRRMGAENQHIKLDLTDESGKMMQFLAFGASSEIVGCKIGQLVNVWYTLDINEWQGRRSVEGRLLHLE